MTSLRIAGQTDVGQHRQDNQDTFISTPLWSAHDALLVVIDGVGGYAGGAQAAAIAKVAIAQYMATPTGDTLMMLREAVVHANNQIVRHKQDDPTLARMCCVLTAAVADTVSNKLLYVHVGDTRLYRLRDQELEKLTRDHSLVGIREDANQLTEREAMHHPRRNEILRDVGSAAHRVDDPDFLESGETDLRPGDGLLLCSDGLTDMLTRAQITDVLGRPLSVTEQVAELIRLANEHGGQDNITVVLAQYPALPDEASAPVTPERPASSSKTITAPMPAQTPTVKPVAEPTPARKGLSAAIMLGLVVLLASVLWRQYESIPPVPAPRPVPVDSSAVRIPATKPDSIRTP